LQLQKQNHTIQDTCAKPKNPEAVNNNLMTQIQSREEALNRNTEVQKKLQTAITRLTNTVKLLNQAVDELFDKPDDVSTWFV
jgi:DNA repair ATPase RecN